MQWGIRVQGSQFNVANRVCVAGPQWQALPRVLLRGVCLLTTCSSSLFLLYQIIDGDEKLQTMHDAAEKYSPQTEVVFKYLQVGGGAVRGPSCGSLGHHNTQSGLQYVPDTPRSVPILL